MKAQIVKINPKTVVIKNTKGVFATISKTKLEFEYKLGDTIILKKNGDEVYFLPNSAAGFQAGNDFWNDSPSAKSLEQNTQDGESNNDKAIVGSVLVIGLAIVAYFFAAIPCLCGAVAATCYYCAQVKDTPPEKRVLGNTLLVIGIIFWIIELASIASR